MSYEFADRLIELRRAQGLSQEELAGKLGLSRQAVSKWERAESAPDIGNLVALSELYEVSLDELVRGATAEPKAEASSEIAEEVPEEVSSEVLEENAEETSEEVSGEVLKEAAESGDSSANTDSIANSANTTSAENFANAESAASTANSATQTVQAVVIEEPQPNAYQQTYGADVQPAATASYAQPAPVQNFANPGAPNSAAPNTNTASHAAPEAPEATTATTAAASTFTTSEAATTATAAAGTSEIPTATAAYNTPETAQTSKPGRAWQVFPYPLLCVVIYLFLGFFCSLWHPGWIIFLTIPFYYWVVNLVIHDPNYQTSHQSNQQK